MSTLGKSAPTGINSGSAKAGEGYNLDRENVTERVPQKTTKDVDAFFHKNPGGRKSAPQAPGAKGTK
jgi:hypothetical protein